MQDTKSEILEWGFNPYSLWSWQRAGIRIPFCQLSLLPSAFLAKSGSFTDLAVWLHSKTSSSTSINATLDFASLLQVSQANPNRITIQTRVEGDRLKIAIADNGPGMPETVKTRIFDHLFTTKAVGKGTGLGLAIARQIVVETHGGKLTCHSVLGEGTEFVIEIPVF